MSWILAVGVVIVILFGFPLIFIGAPFLPSYKKRDSNLDSLFGLLRENRVQKIVDLGSGDGRVVIDFLKAGFDSYGIEINPLLVLWSKIKIKKLKLRAHISWGNFWRKNLSEFDAIFIFQFKTANKLLGHVKDMEQLIMILICNRKGFSRFSLC